VQVGLEEQVAPLQKRVPIFTRSVKGPFRRFKTVMLVLAYSVFFLLPWLPWSRSDGPAQAVLFDLPGRRFMLFDLVIYPQDVIWLALLLFISAVLLFFVTGLVGRAFCGYFCFQTLWTDFFIWIEARLQGERPARIRLYRQSWRDREKLLKVGGTHFLWFVTAFLTGLSFILYYGYAPDLLVRFFTGQAAAAAYITVTILTITTYVAAGLLRESVCTYICPYGRFQSVMYEAETLAVHYDARRGEGNHGRISARGELKQREVRQGKGHGDCIDCGLCVQVCPAGIDIREGLQYRCISCGLCIDACNNIMQSMGYPLNLIRYDSEQNLAQPVPKAPHIAWLRPKNIGYAVSLMAMTAYLVWSISSRTSFELNVEQVRQPLFVVLSNGDIRNRYQVRINNKTDQPQRYRISAPALPPDAVDMGGFDTVLARPGHGAKTYISIRMSAAQAQGVREVKLVITPLGDAALAQTEIVNFQSPGQK
jgi:cytochrome c oxidase accessory protein FixG